MFVPLVGTLCTTVPCMAAKTRTYLTSLDPLERQFLAITLVRAQGDAWEKALKGWTNAGGPPNSSSLDVRDWPRKLRADLKGDKGVGLVAETCDKQRVAPGNEGRCRSHGRILAREMVQTRA